MKKTAVPACVLLILSLVIAAGSQTFLGPCVHEDGSFGACHWAGKMLLGAGCLEGALAALALLQKRAAARGGLYLAAGAAAALGILTPGTLIGLCKMSAMRCRAVMQPAMILLFSLALITAAAGAILAYRKAKNP